MSEGFGVDPEALRTSSQQVKAGADAVGEAAALLALLQLDADALGTVPAAGRFAAAVQAFTSTHSADQEHGSAWIDEASENLTNTAGLYESADNDAAAGMRKAGGR
ncbi:type VII secretion target [Kutzneria sp. 744]|uniref:type VII secretion target n=1 Tax=Kutzneria sp. (strain 744) TaxID=345341 RepID=UPI0004ADB168|nr:type VII secretion target [Kutzneria sp. 744]